MFIIDFIKRVDEFFIIHIFHQMIYINHTVSGVYKGYGDSDLLFN